MALDQNIGMVTAYAYAVSKGYTGTEEQFAQELASAGADLSQIQTQIDNFINTIVPAKTAEVTAEGTRQIGLVAAEGTAQKNAVTEEGTTQKNAVTAEGTTQKNAVNSAGSAQTEAVNAAGASQVENVDTAGTTQVTNINNAGATQITAIQTKGEQTRATIPADYTALSDSVEGIKNEISYLGNWAYLTKGNGSTAVAFEIKQGHTYTVVNTSESGGLTFILRETPTGDNLQQVYGIDAGVTKDFTANQDAHYIAGWQASSQTFFIIDKASKTELWDAYQNQLDDIYVLKYPYVLTAGGFDEADGTITANQYYSYTDFIDCSVFNKLRVIAPTGSLNYCSWYKEDKTTGVRFTVPQGDTTLTMPNGYKYARLSASTSNMTGISVYTALWFVGADSNEFIDKIKDFLPSRTVATRDTSGSVYLRDYSLVKGHSYLLVNPSDVDASFSPLYADGSETTLGSTTVNAHTSNMRVSEIDGYAGAWFAGANGMLYIYDLDGEVSNKTITDMNDFAVNAIQSARYKTASANKLLTLIHFSDIHAEQTGLARVVNFKSDMSAYIDDAICTGDIVGSKFGDSMSFWTNTDGAENILTCVGNHDSYYTNSMDSAQLVPMKDVADKFIAPFETNWGTITRPADCSYYYKDYDSAYRLIVLDSIREGADATAEATWLTNVLADAKANNLAVIIAMHYMPTGAMNISDCAFSKYSEFGESGNICNAPNFAVQELVQTFIDGGGTFMCYLIGHLHRDICGTVKGYPSQPCIMVTTASWSKASQEYNADQSRIVGEKSQDAFNIITFDKANNTFKVVRVGADVDNLMRPRKAISYSIATKAFPQK